MQFLTAEDRVSRRAASSRCAEEASPWDLSGEVIVVTGGGTGLGAAMARALADAGGRAVAVGRSCVDNAETDGISYYKLDVRSQDEVTGTFERIRDDFGMITGLINNAGIYEDMRIGAPSFPRDWHNVIEVNLNGAARCIHAAAKALKSARRGCIVNVGSAYSVYGHHKSAAYSASKAAIVGLSRAAAAELGPDGIRVNTVLPGWFDTKINDGLIGSPRGNYIVNATPLGRWGQPSDVAGAVVFLCSKAAAFISGAELRIDGGYFVSDRDYNHK
jgi:2-deoxy-D-gluconate 3-dehydrogenase